MTDQEPLLRASTMKEAAGFDLELRDSAILVFDESLVPKSRRRMIASHPFRRAGEHPSGVSVVCAGGPGAPSAAVAVEFLAAFGVDTVVAVGSAGDLHARLPVAGHSVSKAVSDEGTSAHYSTHLTADHEVTEGLTAATGRSAVTAVTTDAPFRHTPARLARHRARADVVEMESAAVFAVAHAFNLRAGALVVPSDRFGPSSWQITDHELVRIALLAAVDLAATTIAT